MKYRYILLLSLLISTLSIAYSQERLTIDECRKMAIESSRRLNSAAEQRLSSEDLFAAYRSNRLPNFSMSANYLFSTANYTYTSPELFLPTLIPDATTGELVPNVAGVAADGSTIYNMYAYVPSQTIDFEINSYINSSVSIAQPIYLGGKVNNSIKLAQIGVNVAKLNERLTRAEIITQCDEAFYNYLMVTEMLESAKSYKSVVEEFCRQMKSAYEAGMRTRNDLLKVQVQLNEAELMLQRAENGLRLSRMNLCFAIGLPLSTDRIEVQDTFASTIYTIDSSLDITSRPEYSMLIEQIEAKRVEADITKSDMLPSIKAIASYGYNSGLQLNNETLINSPSLSGGVSMTVPLFHWGEGRRKLSASRRAVTVAENTKSDMSEQMTLELMQSINIYDESVMEVRLNKNALEQAEENMRLSKSHYEAGMETLGDYLESQALWQKAMSDLIASKSAQRVAYTRYQKARGLNQ